MQSYADFENFLTENKAVVAYFSHDECNVCKVLKPKVIELLESSYPKIKFSYINIKNTPEISAQQSIFTVPTIVAYFEGKEFVRKSRSFSLQELNQALEKPYNIIYG